MTKRWRERLGRLDSLFLRLFLLMWVTLVLSQLVAFSVVSPFGTQWVGHLFTDGAAALPPLPSLPPVNPLTGGEPDGLRPPGPAWHRSAPLALGPEGERPLVGGGGLPAPCCGWTTSCVRSSPSAWALGARWLSVPMRRLAHASRTLSKGLAGGRARPRSTTHGSVEVRDVARAFNRMAQRPQAPVRPSRPAPGRGLARPAHAAHAAALAVGTAAERRGPSGQGVDIRAMDELIDASLAVVREQSTSAEPALLDLGALLQSLTDDLAEQGLPVTLAGDVGTALAVRLRAHPASLRRVVDNLVGNALRYGGVARLGCRWVDGWAEVTVDDDGPGIAPAQLERVFQPWVRLPDRTARAAAASGSPSRAIWRSARRHAHAEQPPRRRAACEPAAAFGVTPRSAARYPPRGAALAVRRSRPGGALEAGPATSAGPARAGCSVSVGTQTAETGFTRAEQNAAHALHGHCLAHRRSARSRGRA